jgi:hypothetical protein
MSNQGSKQSWIGIRYTHLRGRDGEEPELIPGSHCYTPSLSHGGGAPLSVGLRGRGYLRAHGVREAGVAKQKPVFIP